MVWNDAERGAPLPRKVGSLHGPLPLLLLLALLCIFGTAKAADLHTVDVTVTSVQEEGGLIRAALFDDPRAFPEGRDHKDASVPVTHAGKVHLKFHGVPSGTYAISLYHDANGNDQFDQGAFGIPKESYGFSEIDHAVLGPPGFNDARFTVKGDTAVTVELQAPPTRDDHDTHGGPPTHGWPPR
ncbi:MAG: DUF2141 domain-containing protein [Alphaproteobacteria bacterium]|nr:DUF2141 domain-containing protein [Alphaproteobacteria bacterium]